MLFVILVVLTIVFVVFVVRQLLLQRRIAERKAARQRLDETAESVAHDSFTGATEPRPREHRAGAPRGVDDA